MIQIENICKSFGCKAVLDNVSLICEKGKVQALLGANGAGKSTLIHIISQLSEADKGAFSIDGEYITYSSHQYRKKVGYVFENPIYVEKMTALEYLHFVSKLYHIPTEVAKEKVTELICFFELEDASRKTIQQFSKGMKSKISLAASLVHSPDYLIYDEPFDGIDFLMSQKIIQQFKKMAAKGVTFLITSHQFDIIAELADNFAILKNGTILFNRPYRRIIDDISKSKENIKEYIQKLMENPVYSGL
jgi:ABC-2 type transport system ATP-binding protein